jgi:hypothetical protein
VASTLTPIGQRRAAAQERGRGVSFVRRHSLALAALAIFAACLVGQMLTGHDEYNSDQLEHGGRSVSITTYLGEGHFWEAIFENWESEFLQMGSYVVLTAYLLQRGSSESKDPDAHEAVDDDPRDADLRKRVPWPVRKGGIVLKLYENSLLIAFALLFLGSMVGHAIGGVADYNQDLKDHGQHAVSTWDFFTSSHYWFQSFQNWQSEFLAVLAIVVLSIFLRQRGSPESKPVAAPHSATGS